MEEDIKILENFFEDRMDVEEEKWALERILKTFRLLNSKLIHLSDEEYRNVIELAQKDSIPKSKVKEVIDRKCKAFRHRTSIEKILECEFKRLEEELLREE